MHGYLSVQAVVFGKADEVQRALGARDKVSADVCVSAGGTYGGMTEKDLNDPEIFSGLHEVGIAKEWRRVWKVTDLDIPAAATAFLKV